MEAIRALRRGAACRCWACASATRRWPQAFGGTRGARRAGARQDRRGRARRQDDLRRASNPRSWSAATTRWSSTPSCRTSSRCRARSGDVIMGLRHRELPAEGVQFHPESVLTPHGKQLLAQLPRGCLTPSSRRRSTGSPTGEDLDADEAAARPARDHGGQRVRGAGGGVPDRAAHEGRDGRRDRRARRDDARAARCRCDAGDDLVDTAGTGGGRPDVQRLDHRRASSRPAPAAAVAKHGNRSATEPVRLGRRARGARRADRPGAGRGRGVHRRGRLRLHVRAAAPPGDQAHRARCAGSWACARSSTSSAR